MKQKQKIIWGIFLFFWLFSFAFADVFVSDITSTWAGYSNTCASAEINHVTVTPASIPSFWTGNTVYDFTAGTYILTAGISLTQPCTALVWTDGVTINGNGSPVFSISSNYTLIKNLTINGNAADAISANNTNSITITNATIYGANRWILLSTVTNSVIKDSKIFWNTIGISLATNTNNNIFNNIITFNNSQYWIAINMWSRNTINNILSFNNNLYWIIIQAGIQNVLNNAIIYNNSSNGIRFVAGNYLNQVKTFNNNNDIYSAITTWYGNNDTSRITFPTANLKFWLANDSILWSIGRTNWSMSTGFHITSNDIFNPHNGSAYLIDTTTASGTWRWVKTFWTTFDVNNSLWGANVPTQIQPVQWNTAGTQLLSSSLPYYAGKKIGEIVVSVTPPPSSPNGYTNVARDPICGNGMKELDEQCDDGNKWNGDWCTASCQIEQPGICGNGILEYTERCDDGNTKDGDTCSSTCQLETDTLILNSKQLLQKTALQKTLGIPSALIDTKAIETTSDFILAAITQHQQQQIEQCQYVDANYRTISFGDISWNYQQQIETLLNYCIIQGKTVGNKRFFWSKDVTTYVEFIKVLVKTHFLWSSLDFHNNTFDIQNIYSDVPKNSWYAPYIIKAYVHDLLLPVEKIQGKSLTISPEKTITRLDAIRLLIHSLKLANKNPQNIEIITDTFQNANQPLTREEMAALIVYWYQLDYNSSLRLRSDNAILIKLLAQHIKKYNQSEQRKVLETVISKISLLNDQTLKRFNIYKKELLADLSTLIDFSEVFLK